jgi:hypothetical protein
MKRHNLDEENNGKVVFSLASQQDVQDSIAKLARIIIKQSPSSSLHSIEIHCRNAGLLQDSDAVTLMDRLCQDCAHLHSLENLHLKGLSDGYDLKPLFASLVASSSPLKVLTLDPLREEDAEGTNGFLSATNLNHAAAWLWHNPSLQEFQAHVPEFVSLQPFVAALENNSNLKRLRLYGALHFPLDDLSALVDLLETKQQYTLEQLHIGCPLLLGGQIQKAQQEIIQLQFLLKLNQFHRKQMLSCAAGKEEQDECVQTLIHAKEEPSVVFYFLTHNPSLILNAIS